MPTLIFEINIKWKQERGKIIIRLHADFFIIATLQKSVLEGYRNLISLQLINLYGKVTLWFNKCDISPLSATENLNFVKHLKHVSLSLCEGVWKPSKDTQYDLLDRRLRLDPQTFTFLYQVKEFLYSIIVKSR